MRQPLVLISLITALLVSPAAAALITSTAEGGFWELPGTWIGGTVPGSDDDAIVAGPIYVGVSGQCRDLEVLPAGSIQGASSGYATLSAGGDVSNLGLVTDGSFYFTVEVGGDLHNEGSWTLHQTRFSGNGPRQLSMSPSGDFISSLDFTPGAGGEVQVSTPIRIKGNVELEGGSMILSSDCPFTLDEGVFKGQLYCNGNEMIFESWAYLSFCTVDAAVLVGEVEVSTLVEFTGGLTVMGVLQNLSSTGNGHVHISGGLVNKGVIRNNHYGFTIELSGDLVNEGSLENSYISLDGVGEQHFSMTPAGIINCNIFLPEFDGGTIVADTPLQIADGVNLGPGVMILEPGSDLHFSAWGSLGGSFSPATLLANGNGVYAEDEGGLHDITVDRAVLHGPLEISGVMRFTSGVTVAGILQNYEYILAQAEVEGLFLNEGEIRDFGGYELWLTLLGDAENRGIWHNSRVVVAGSEDQAIGAGAGIAVPEFILDSKLEATSYQWYRDGAPLPGEISAQLTLATVGPNDFGLYHCTGDGGDASRNISIAEFADPSDSPPTEAMATRIRNHPNPFNPRTQIAFSLDRSGPARLSVHDPAGREVALLVDGILNAGEHRVDWQPEGLSSGIYLYRLHAGGTTRLGKCTLLK